MREDTEEFFRMSLRYGIEEPKYHHVDRYMNRLKYAIMDEMITHYFRTMD